MSLNKTAKLQQSQNCNQ
uniref:Uncharacterized protein n=1 Tax=Rhizophora mucronata TaxID=61149 RepID=A0A2P2QKB8_RHIMU